MSSAAPSPTRFRSIVAVVILAAILLGFFPLGRLSIGQPSSDAVPRLRVEFSVPGLTAPAMETLLTRPLENLLADTPDLAGMESVTTGGKLQLDLRPSRPRDIDSLQREVQSRLERTRISWPASMDPPAVLLVDASAQAAQFSVTSRTQGPLALRDWVETEFARRLRELPGVDVVEVKGGAIREIRVMPDQRRLAGLGLSFDDLLQAIRKHPELAAMPSPASKKRPGREPLQSGNVTAVSAIPVPLPEGESLHLGEIASLTHVVDPESSRNGPESIQVTVHKQPSADPAGLARRIDAHVDWMRANRLIPEGIELNSLAGPLEHARQSLKNLARALVAGFTLVLLVSLFLYGARRTLVLGVIVAASLQAVLVAMVLAGAELDSVTFAGLALGVGLFSEAALLLFAGAAQPGGTAVARASALAAAGAMAAALAPVIFAGGELGLRYREWALALGGAWLLSALLAMGLVPVFDARRKGIKPVPWGAAVYRVVRRAYGRLLEKALQRARATLIFFALITTGFIAAWAAHDFALPAGRPLSGEITLRLQCPDNADSTAVADDVVQRLSALPALRRISHSARSWREELRLHLQEDRARDVGVDIAAAGRALAIALTGINVGSFRDADHRYNVLMRLPPEEAGAAATGGILLLGELERRPAVYLRDVAVIERAVVPAEIRRHDGKPAIDIIATLAPDAAPLQALENTGTAIAGMNLPPGYRLSFGPENTRQGIGLKALGMALLLTFLLQALLNRSPRFGLQITLVAGIVVLGTGAALILGGMSFTPAAWLGLIMLLGIVAGHSATLITSVETHPDPVLSRRLRHAARHQFAPLLAVAAIGVLGMASLTWVNGDAFIEDILFVLIAGLLLSLPVNLFMTPLLYWLFSRKEQISRP